MEKEEENISGNIHEEENYPVNILKGEKKKLVLNNIAWVLKKPLDGKNENSNFTIFEDSEDNLILSSSDGYVDDYRCLAMCQMPGRKKSMATNKKNLKLQKDFERLSKEGITAIVCLVNMYEMRSRGVPYKDYLAYCEKYSIEVIKYEINDMTAPKDEPPQLSDTLLKRVIDIMQEGGKVAIHCQAGVGRAGTIVSCLLLKLGMLKRAQHVIKYLRRMRYPGCVESSRQMKYVKEFSQMLYGPEKRLSLVNGSDIGKQKALAKKEQSKAERKKRRLPSTLYCYKKLDEIIPGVYVSSAMEAGMKELLTKAEITHILIAGRGLRSRFKGSFTYHHIEIQDIKKAQLSKYLIEGFKFMDKVLTQAYNPNHEKKFNVLIHCLAGASRSVSFTVAYIMLKLKTPFKETLAYVKKRRRQASPNLGFREQLQAFEDVVKSYWIELNSFDDFHRGFTKGNGFKQGYLDTLMPVEINFGILSKFIK